MPRVKTTSPAQSRQKGQRSQQVADYLTRWLPTYRQPEWLAAKVWREIVANQPIAQICMERLISNLLALEWKVEPRDSTKRDEYKDEIEYYTRFIEQGAQGWHDYVSLIEWVLQDYLTLPFGGAVEMGREGDEPEGRVMWVEPLDGGTLFPTLSSDFPVGQHIPGNERFETVYFPWYAINRIYMSPRTDILRKGWGLAPPEKIYLAIELLNRGDKYYANLLLDTPEVGILDLGDIAEDSAKEWLDSWRTMLSGIDPFKIPVLYEHEKPANFISFTRSPTELMFDKATMKYASITCAGYGMSLSDIGISASGNGGETLAGSIRQERSTRKAGYAKAKAKLKLFFDRMLPSYLEMKYIDLDDELAVALGRARLADATAFSTLIDKQVFTPDEARQQIVADGLINISIPEKMPESERQKLLEAKQPAMFGGNQSAERPGLLGRPVAPSQGGWGEKRSQALDVAMEVPEFKTLYAELEEKWDELSESVREDVLGEINRILSDIERTS